ncbi:MAG: NusG domain II-containing protein [Lachnospiraceae bacterium]|nr:NusG domain II-containing protein [Lachnospiraceae bacterium]
MKKNDVILIAVLVAAALAVFLGISLYASMSTESGEAVVYLDGKEQGRYPLEQDMTVEIEAQGKNYNILEIREGKAEIREATCPDKICVNHRPIEKRGESLVCLPNKVVVEIENGRGQNLDGTTN